MTGFTFKARCPVCNLRVRIRDDGTLRVHPPRGDEKCPGSGQLSKRSKP